MFIYNTELDNQENFEDYLEFSTPEICHTVLSWKIILIESKKYLCRWMMLEQGKVKTQ